jgi:hypothetical protein
VSMPKLVDVGGVLLARLRVSDFMELNETVWLQAKRQLIDDLDEAHVDDAARADALRVHGQKRGLPELVAYWAWRLDGAKAIIERAAKNAGVPCPDIDGMPPRDVVNAARLLVWEEPEGPKAQTAAVANGSTGLS